MGQVDRVDWANFLRSPQSAADLRSRQDCCRTAYNSVPGADWAGDESRPRPRGARSQEEQSWRDVAALYQPLGRRLHAADANPDGRTIFLQCHQQIRLRLVEW